MAKPLSEAYAELQALRQHAVNITLDPDTAHGTLFLSKDGKQVSHDGIEKNLPDNTKRFEQCAYVLGKQGFSSGRFYYEVQAKDKTNWYLGVARESVNRKALRAPRPKDGYWTICLKNASDYFANDDSSVLLPNTKKVQKVGVFVDYEGGLVSFHDVETRVHLYSFTGCTFTDKLYPFFSPCNNLEGQNSAPLIIFPLAVTGGEECNLM